MADQDEDEQRRLLEEFQRQQAEKARLASQGQPNAIPSEPSQSVRAVDYAPPNEGRGIVLGAVGGPSTASMNRPIQDWGSPIAPIGGSRSSDYTSRGLIPNQGENAPFEGSLLSDQETQFWQANPLGAVKDSVTGNLIGLGDTPARAQQVTEAFPQRIVSTSPMGGTVAIGPPRNLYTNPPINIPSDQQPQRQEIPNFVNIPEVDPNIGARRNQIAQSIADIDRRLPSAQTQRIAKGQPSERERLIQERAHYVRADDVLASELHNQNQARTHASDLNMKMRDQYATTADATALREDFHKIKSKPGTPQYAQDVLNLRINHPDAMRDPKSVELLDRAARGHEEEAAFLARAQAQGVTPQVTGFHQGRTTYKITEPTSVPNNVAARYARLQADVANHLEHSAVQAQENSKANRPNEPYKNAAQLHASQIEMQNLEKRFLGLNPQQQTNAAAPQATSEPFDYSKIPSGTVYTDPNGVRRRKP